MAFGSFVGRVLFASFFILSAYQEFNEYGVDGAPIAKILRPKIDVLTLRLHSHVGIQMPEIETKHVVAAAIALKGIGGVLFVFGSLLGAHLLYDSAEKQFPQLFLRFTQNMALVGALLFFIGMKNST